MYVFEAKGLPVKESYVKVQLGKYKSKTRIIKNSINPVWNEEFVFKLDDVDDDDEVVFSAFHHDGDDSGFFHSGSGDFMGRVRIPVLPVFQKDNQMLPPTWFSLEKSKTGKFTHISCG